MKCREWMHDRQELYQEGCRLREEYAGEDEVYLRRLDAVLLVLNGVRTLEVAKKTGISTSCLNLWVRKADHKGFEALKSDATVMGRPRKLSKQQFTELKERIQQEYDADPGTWTCAFLRNYLEEEYDIQVSDRTARRILYKATADL